MVAIRPIALLLALALLSLSPSSSRAGAPSTNSEDDLASNPHASLFAQAAAEAIERNFPSRDISFLLLDASTGNVLASRWDHPATPIPMGSLFKPFAALAYGEQHEFQYPVHTCRGAATGCWLPRGHGKVNLTSAIAQSCNSYFRMLTADMTSTDVAPTATRFGLAPPPRTAAGAQLAGLGNDWRTSPLRMARAYIELARDRDQPAVSQILDGMAESARYGTAAALHRALPSLDALAKTGTAACTHVHRSPGDGFVVVLIPADHPQLLFLIRVHGVPGSHAAQTAAQMLHRIED
jgi:cell division protein FtsI/penicillin-binding protein 2